MSDKPQIACNPTAIDKDARGAHEDVATALFERIIDLRERSDGYAFRLPAESEVVRNAGAFVSRERLCCPFFQFTIEVTPDQGPVWLTLTGRNGVKEYIEDVVLPYWDLENDPSASPDSE